MFLYFADTAEPLLQIKADLFWDLPDGAILPVATQGKGPSGKTGSFMASPGMHRHHGYSPENQEWIDCGTHWIGWDKQALPTPEQLQRKRLVSGHDETLNDGNIWHCPTIRKIQGGMITTGLPQVIQRFGDNFTATIKPRYQSVWGVACHAWDAFAAGGITVGEYVDFASCFLGVNYRISHNEASALQLYDDDSLSRIVSVALDLDAITKIADELKKKE